MGQYESSKNGEMQIQYCTYIPDLAKQILVRNKNGLLINKRFRNFSTPSFGVLQTRNEILNVKKIGNKLHMKTISKIIY